MTRAAIARSGLAVASLLAGPALAGPTLAACGGDFVIEPVDASAGAPGTGLGRPTGKPSVEDEGGTSGLERADASRCADPGVDCPGVPPCPNGESPATLTGTVFDPAGKNPLYNAVVYVPQADLPPIATGTNTCTTCGTPVSSYVTATATDATGKFTLPNVPTGMEIPLVVQAGKWRREMFVPLVRACTTTAVPPELTRLPRNHYEGDLPQMAALTGACDGIACFLRRVGVDAQEFTGPDGDGRVHVYRGAGPGPDLAGGGGGTAGDCTGTSGACPLWSTKAALERYDNVFLGCECGENNQTKPDMAPMHDWLGEGGLVIAVHNQETWFKNGPADFQTAATWTTADAAAPGPFLVDTTFQGGKNMQKWLGNTGALASDGTVSLNPPDVSDTMASAGSQSSRWIYEDGSDAAAASVAYLSFGTPVGGIGPPQEPPQYCGRAIVTDVHVGASAAPSTAAVPASCDAGDLSPEEKALEFMLFDVPLCVETVLQPPNPPPPPPK
jgi:hypothetical protein